MSRKYLFLEIKPTARTLKSPLSTAQLFTILHSLEKPHHWLDKLLGLTKSISYELVSNKNDGIRFILRVGVEDAPSIRKTLLAYLPGIKIKEVDDHVQNNPKLYSLIRELQLKKLFIYPIASQETLNQYDPLAYFTAHMTKLQADEVISLQFVCSSIHESTHSGTLSFITAITKKFLSNEDITDLIEPHNGRYMVN